MTDIKITDSKEIKKKVDWDKNTLFIDGNPTILYSGEFQYFRVPYQEWKTRLEKAVALGINCISTYIPWNWHEKTKGQLKWDQQHNLQEFLDLCKKLKLYVIVKPGPYICAEWDSGGFPLWIFQKNITLRSPDSEYMDLVTRWYEEVIQKVRPYLISQNGTIVLFQIENEFEHYLTYDPTCGITREQGKAYITKLLMISEEKGIDVPIYLNGSPNLSKELDLIDAVDFWSDIPFLWHFEFKLFNKFLENALLRDKPLFISELQAGWYDQVGEKHYEAPDILEANIKNAIGHRAAIINIFMLAGGSTLPHYNCKGDSALCAGTENTTSYDFGAPIRESGGYNFRKASDILLGWKFIQTYRDAILYGKSEGNGEVKNETTRIIGFHDTDVEDNLNLSGLICKRFSSETEGFLYINNLSDIPQKIQLFVKNDKSFPLSLIVGSKKSYILPSHHHVHNIKILRSNAEIFIVESEDPEASLICVISDGINEPALTVMTDFSILSDNPKTRIVNVGPNIYTITHAGHDLDVLQIDQKSFVFFVAKESAPYIRSINNLILFPSGGIILRKDDSSLDNKLVLDLMQDAPPTLRIFCSSGNDISIRINQQSVKPYKKHKILPLWSFDFKNVMEHAGHLAIEDLIQWSGQWTAGAWESGMDASTEDSHWRTAHLSVPLERMSNVQPGYVFYRLRFPLIDFKENYELEYDGGDIHKSYVYINERLIFAGKGKAIIKLAEILEENNVLTIRYAYHFHTKGYHNSGPFIQQSGIKKIILHNKTHSKDTEFFNLKIKNVPMEILSFITDKTQFLLERPSDGERWIFQSKGLVHLKREFSFSSIEGQWDVSVGLKILGVHERALIYINGNLLGKYEDKSPQEVFFIPLEVLRTENRLDLVMEGPGLNRIGEAGCPSFSGVQFVFMHCKPKVELELESLKVNSSLLKSH